MVHSEIDVINKIRESKDPDRAMQIAIKVILEHLTKKESFQAK